MAAKNIDELSRLENDLQSAIQKMNSMVKYEDTAIFMGTTRSGKSSLLNYLIGNKLIGIKIRPVRPVSIEKADNAPGPKIGIGPTSETVFPSRWSSSKLPGLALWDAPGFDDNRGVVQDITNAFYITELFKNIKSAKIVLVTDINDLVADNIRSFLSLLNSIEKLLNAKMKGYFSHIAVIFSKGADTINDSLVDKEFINSQLSCQILENKDIQMSATVRDFIRHLTENNQQIGFFKRAILGNVTDAINNGIFEAINSTNSIQAQLLKQMSPSIADQSNVFLLRVREQLYSKNSFIELQKLLQRVFNEKMQAFEHKKRNEDSREILHQLSEELSKTKVQLENAIGSHISFNENLNMLKMIDFKVDNYIRDRKLNQRAQLMKFTDHLLGFQESKLYDSNLKTLMTSALANIEELLARIKLQISKITDAEDEQKRKIFRQLDPYYYLVYHCPRCGEFHPTPSYPCRICGRFHY